MSTVRLPNICLIGKAGSGKTTLAELLETGQDYHRISFASPLKVMADTTTDRARLQQLGLDVRALDPLAWVRLALAEMDRLTDEAVACSNVLNGDRPRFVVDDCRFPNELDALREDGFVVVKVSAGDSTRAGHSTRVGRLRANGKLTDEAQLEHESETALDGEHADHYVINDAFTPLESLRHQLTAILNREAR